MTEEEKQLLLQDLAARLPYEIILLSSNEKITYQTDGDTAAELLVEEGWKPYLRPMSSMTEEEENEWFGLNTDPLLEAVGERHTRIEDLMLRAKSQYNPVDWLNAHHFDYRGLISIGLAIEVTSENNPYKE